MWRAEGRWHARLDRPRARLISSRSRAACLEKLRADAGKALLTVEVVPDLVGVAEAAEILGWDKRRVFTYISRDSFPEPVAYPASGRIWRRADIEGYARERRGR